MINNHAVQYKNNASALFGWQLSAIFGSTSLQAPLCSSFSSPERTSTSALRTAFTLGAVSPPLCLRTGCGLAKDGQNIFLHILTSVRNVFNLKFLTAFDNKQKTWLTMCNTLNSARLKGFLLQDTTIGIVCGLAGYSTPPTPDIGDDVVPSDLVLHNAASELLGWCLVALFNSQSQITSFCSSFSSYAPKTAGINLDPTIVNGIVCPYQTQTLPTTSQLTRNMDIAWTHIFATTLFAVSDSTQYLEFVCKGYKNGHLNNFVKDVDFEDVLVPLVVANCQAADV